MCVGPRRVDNAGAKRAILYYGVEYFISLQKEPRAPDAAASLFVRSDKVRETNCIVKYEPRFDKRDAALVGNQGLEGGGMLYCKPRIITRGRGFLL